MSSNTCRYNASSVSTTGMVPVPSSPLVSSGSHGSHGPSSPSSLSSSSILKCFKYSKIGQRRINETEQ
ncbi:hypothetical protein G6F64_015559 [Rhizopus arrhizus]|uniref:Uncharacterized protein n=1 Tax=Rhizopus oryzae TaxID=64495 RepID=A0A9P7BGM8_RHIOR|nr:hypothetical protein G6F64_015559 [Rhizopus arrhizus]